MTAASRPPSEDAGPTSLACAVQPKNVIFNNARGEPVIRIELATGRVFLEVDPDEAAREFWRSVERLAPVAPSGSAGREAPSDGFGTASGPAILEEVVAFLASGGWPEGANFVRELAARSSSAPDREAPSIARLIESEMGDLLAAIGAGDPNAEASITQRSHVLAGHIRAARSLPDTARDSLAAIRDVLCRRFPERAGDPLYDAVFAHVAHVRPLPDTGPIRALTDEELNAAQRRDAAVLRAASLPDTGAVPQRLDARPCRHCGASEAIHEPILGTCPDLGGGVYEAADEPAAPSSVPAHAEPSDEIERRIEEIKLRVVSSAYADLLGGHVDWLIDHLRAARVSGDSDETARDKARLDWLEGTIDDATTAEFDTTLWRDWDRGLDVRPLFALSSSFSGEGRGESLREAIDAARSGSDQ